MNVNSASGTAESIQRLDWRFLLPLDPDRPLNHLIIHGASRQLLNQARAYRIARRVSDANDPAAQADAVAVLSSSPVGPAEAVRDVAPGGTLYYEVSRHSLANLPRTPGSIARQITDLGFSISVIYWLLPNASSPLRYIPLDRTEAFGWYMNAHHSAGSPVERVREMLIRGISGLRGSRFAHFAPDFAVVAKRDSEDRNQLMAPAPLRKYFDDDSVRPVLLTRGIDDGSRVVFAPFTSRSREPEYILKLARLPAFNANIKREQQTLRELRARIGHSIPEPFGVHDHRGLAIGVEEYVRGQSLSALSWRWPRSVDEKIADLRLVTDWIIRFNTLLAGQPGTARELPNTIQTTIDEFREVGRGSSARARLFDRMSKSVDRVHASTPLVWRHNDLGPWNVFLTRSGIRVIDWEYGTAPNLTLHGPPLVDLLYFATHWFFAASRFKTLEAESAGFRELYFAAHPQSRPVRAVRQSIRRYMSEMRIDRMLFPALLTHTWIVAALERNMREQRLNAEGESTSFEQFIDILAAHPEQMGSPSEWLSTI